MEQLSYGEMIAARQEEARSIAAQERRARAISIHGTYSVGSLRVAAGRFLVSAGERIAGCAELARAEINPTAKVLG